MEPPAVAGDPYGSADPAPLPADAELGPNVGSAMSLHDGPAVDAVEAVEEPQRHHRRIPAGNTGDKMPPVTPTPGVSEPLLPAGRLSGSSLAEGLSSRPPRPVLYPPR